MDNLFYEMPGTLVSKAASDNWRYMRGSIEEQGFKPKNQRSTYSRLTRAANKGYRDEAKKNPQRLLAGTASGAALGGLATRSSLGALGGAAIGSVAGTGYGLVKSGKSQNNAFRAALQREIDAGRVTYRKPRKKVSKRKSDNRDLARGAAAGAAAGAGIGTAVAGGFVLRAARKARIAGMSYKDMHWLPDKKSLKVVGTRFALPAAAIGATGGLAAAGANNRSRKKQVAKREGRLTMTPQHSAYLKQKRLSPPTKPPRPGQSRVIAQGPGWASINVAKRVRTKRSSAVSKGWGAGVASRAGNASRKAKIKANIQGMKDARAWNAAGGRRMQAQQDFEDRSFRKVRNFVERFDYDDATRARRLAVPGLKTSPPRGRSLTRSDKSYAGLPGGGNASFTGQGIGNKGGTRVDYQFTGNKRVRKAFAPTPVGKAFNPAKAIRAARTSQLNRLGSRAYARGLQVTARDGFKGSSMSVRQGKKPLAITSAGRDRASRAYWQGSAQKQLSSSRNLRSSATEIRYGKRPPSVWD